MLTALLRSKTPAGILLSFAIAIAMLVFGFFFSQPKGGPSDLLFTHWAFNWFDVDTSVVPLVCISLASGMLVISRVRFREVKATLAERNIGMVVMSAIVSLQSNPLFTRPDVVAAALLMLVLFMVIFSTYKRESVLSEVFHVGLLLGFASVLLGQSIVLILSVGFSLVILRTGNWKEWFVLVLGLIMTMVFIWLFLIWHESPFISFQQMVQTSWLGGFRTEAFNLGHILLAAPMLLAFSGGLSDLAAGTVHERNVTLVNLGWIIGVLLMVLLFGLGWQSGLILAAFPISTFVSRSLQSMNRWWVADLLLLALMAAPFVRNLWQL